MTERSLKLVTGIGKVLGLVALVLGFVNSGSAQSTQSQSQRPSSLDGDKASDDGPRAFATLEEEMRAKRAIKYAEKEYQENLNRARDLSTLGSLIVTSFKEKNALDREDVRKLEKVEKLTKGIRSAAGGSDDDTEMEKPPKDLAAAVEMLGDLSKSLKEKVDKTPKRVISAAIIDESNVLLELIRMIRTFAPKG